MTLFNSIILILLSWGLVTVSLRLMVPVRLFGGLTLIPILSAALLLPYAMRQISPDSISPERNSPVPTSPVPTSPVPISPVSNASESILSMPIEVTSGSADRSNELYAQTSLIKTGPPSEPTKFLDFTLLLQGWAVRSLSVVKIFLVCALLLVLLGIFIEVNEDSDGSVEELEHLSITLRASMLIGIMIWLHVGGHILWWEAILELFSSFAEVVTNLIPETRFSTSTFAQSAGSQVSPSAHSSFGAIFPSLAISGTSLILSSKMVFECLACLGSQVRRSGSFDGERKALRLLIVISVLFLVWDRTPQTTFWRLDAAVRAIALGRQES